MDPVLLIVLIVLAVLLVGGTGLALLRGRSDHTPTLEPSVTDSADSILTEPKAKEAVPAKKAETGTEPDVLDEPDVVDEPIAEPEPEPEAKPATFRERLGKARSAMSGYLSSVISRGDVNAETWDELEEALIRADVGIGATTDILDTVRANAEEQGVKDGTELIGLVKDEMKARLGGHDISLAEGGDPSVWLFVGVNGVGKTTTPPSSS